MMTKDEIKAMIAETIQTNNKKAITAQSLANVLTTMAENSGEGGGLKYSEERTIYGLMGTLTEEEKAYNVETFNKTFGKEIGYPVLVWEGMILQYFGEELADEGEENRVRFFYMFPDRHSNALAVSLAVIYESGSVDIELFEMPLGGGLKFSEERTLYGINEEVLTDEQKAYNAETYNKIMNSEAVTINIGGMFPLYSTAYPADGSEPTVDLFISFNFSGYEITFNVHLHSDGSTDVTVVEGRYILVSEDDTYETLASTLEAQGIMAGYTGNPIWISSQWGEGYNTRIMFFGIDSVRYIIIEFTDSEGVRHAVYADSESNKVSYTRQGGATIYVNVSETDTTYTHFNKYLFPAKKYEYADIISFTVEVLNEGYMGDPDYEYRPLSYGRHFANGFVDYYTITIYRNNTFETWKINADGTSTLVTT